MQVLFLDTNIFLQCRDLAQLPWEEITQCDEILLLISRPVQDEIDQLKHDGNSRRAKRARKATSFIRKIILAENSELLIRPTSPEVQISFSPVINLTEGIPEILDTSRPDDQIIAEAIAYKAKNQDRQVAILTHDTNPILTAKRCGLDFILIPENWLLPSEPDARDKRITELERRLGRSPIV